ncbi:MAG: restriction endonuclease [Deltaproteobacteria bacterium]|nr:restriction endonuclease [Deltaproteobacteria bacterium]MBN2672687.1 restriction endonuclease [Deltaproteobacteria bacterium]
MVNKQLRKARRRPHTRGGKVTNWAGTSAVFMVVMSLAFLRFQLNEWLVASLAVLFVLLIYLAKRYEHQRSMAHVDEMSGHDFERYLVKVFRANGYTAELIGDRGADFGADLICQKNGIRYAVQAKNYDRTVHKVGNDAVQQAIAGATYYDCGEAMVVTNSHFTSAARQQAQASQVIPVTLIGRDQLKRMIKHL